jgi:hypothetical protein
VIFMSVPFFRLCASSPGNVQATLPEDFREPLRRSRTQAMADDDCGLVAQPA